jgi:hypothetical protein
MEFLVVGSTFMIMMTQKLVKLIMGNLSDSKTSCQISFQVIHFLLSKKLFYQFSDVLKELAENVNKQ